MNVELIKRLREHYDVRCSAGFPVHWPNECVGVMLHGWGEVSGVNTLELQTILGISRENAIAMFYLEEVNSTAGTAKAFWFAPLPKQKTFLLHMFDTLLAGKMELKTELLR